jgi:hypothetical protein
MIRTSSTGRAAADAEGERIRLQLPTLLRNVRAPCLAARADASGSSVGRLRWRVLSPDEATDQRNATGPPVGEEGQTLILRDDACACHRRFVMTIHADHGLRLLFVRLIPGTHVQLYAVIGRDYDRDKDQESKNGGQTDTHSEPPSLCPQPPTVERASVEQVVEKLRLKWRTPRVSPLRPRPRRRGRLQRSQRGSRLRRSRWRMPEGRFQPTARWPFWRWQRSLQSRRQEGR